jgi:capsular polysaccharide biosynthesis protein/DNA-binding CsgD family transcriptional regulator
LTTDGDPRVPREARAALTPVQQTVLQLWTGSRCDDEAISRRTGISLESIPGQRGRIVQKLSRPLGVASVERAVLNLWLDHGLGDAEIARMTALSLDTVTDRRELAISHMSRALGVPVDEIGSGLAAVASASARIAASATEHPPDAEAGEGTTRGAPPNERPGPGSRSPAMFRSLNPTRWAARLPERTRIILGGAVTAALTALVVQALAPQHFQATARLLVSPVRAADPNFAGIPLLTTTGASPSAARGTAQTLVASPAVAAESAIRMGSAWSPSRVTSSVDVAAAANANIVDVTATTGTAASATRLANTYAAAALALRRAQLRPALATQLAISRSQLEALTNDPALPASGPEQRYAALALLAGRGDPTLTLARPAVLSGQPGRLHTLGIVIIALVCGGLLGAIGAWFAGPLSRRRIADRQRIVGLTGLPVLGAIGADRTGLDGSHSFDRLVSLLAEIGPPLRTIALIRPDGDGDHAEIASAVAVALAERGAMVGFIDMDWRRWDGRRADRGEAVTRSRSGAEPLDILGPSPLDPNVLAGTISSEAEPAAMGAALERAIARVDRVIIDVISPRSPAAAAGIARADLALLVVPLGQADETEVVDLQQAMFSAGALRAAVVTVAPQAWRPTRRGRGRPGRLGRRLRYTPSPSMGRPA